jgi:hypothetical protein
MKAFLLGLLLLGAAAAASAQWIRVDSVFSPCGVIPLNFSAPAFGDFDGDGLPEFLMGNTASSRVEYYRPLGPSLPPKYARDTTVLASIYALGIPGTNSYYPAVVDIDGDNDLDLVIGGYNGLLLYRNVGDPFGPVWLKDDTTFAQVNTMIGTDAKPAFGDLDGDGDPDLLVGIGESLFGGPTPGITMGFRNTGTVSSPQFTLDNTLVSGIPDVGLNSYPVLKDLDSDGDLDLLIGRDLSTLVYFQNTGNPMTPAWTASSSVFSVVEATTYWKNPVLVDLNGDGKIDLLYGTADGRLYFYRNTGTPTAPAYQYDASYFQVVRITGNAATASLGDFDGDGDTDLISGDWLGGFQYFRNDGIATAPRFTKTTSSFTSIDVGSYSSPVFVDLDGDSDLDIVSGALDGMLYCYINTGTGFTQNTTIFAGMDVGWRSTPTFGDLDGDGDLDMIVGAEEAVQVRAYRNQGSHVFVQDNVLIAGVTFVRNSSPKLVDLDGDGDLDLVVGAGSGSILFYENTGTPFSPVWSRNDAVFAGVRARQDASPGFSDLNGDGKPDVVVGEYVGNFTYYMNAMPSSVHEDRHGLPVTPVLYQNYPNPFNPATSFAFEIHHSAFIILRVHDLLGREVATLVNETKHPGRHEITWNAEGLSSGVYLYRLTAGNISLTGKMILLQ